MQNAFYDPKAAGVLIDTNGVGVKDEVRKLATYDSQTLSSSELDKSKISKNMKEMIQYFRHQNIIS